MNRLIAAFLVSLSIFAVQVQADWTADIVATGEQGTGPNIFTIVIGQAADSSFLPAPPPPPQYMTYANLYEQDWTGPYQQMLYAGNGRDTLKWLVEVDPNGNAAPPIPRTTTLSWDPAELPQGAMVYMEDFMTSQLLISDMTTTTSYNITGNSESYLNIIMTNLSAVGDRGGLEPTDFQLNPNYPNPFNPATRISFSMPVKAQVNLSVYNIQGELVANLMNGEISAGSHSVEWNAEGQPSGIYFCRIVTAGYTAALKMLLMK